ncbi:MAG: hypothetical protein V4754_18330 [Pseudomonadota bacterium]
MDENYSWIILVAAGAVLGMLVSARAVAAFGIALVGISLVGLLLSSLSGNETLTWTFGIAGMVTPALMITIWLGALLGALGKRVAQKTR